MQTEKNGGRYALLDELRGFDLLNMFVYHALWDLVFLYGLKAEWYTGWLGRLWQQFGCWIFILLSGFCLPFGRRPVQRGAFVFCAGAAVTAVTLLAMPQQPVWFGVLTLLGTAMMLTGGLQPFMRRVPPVLGFGVCMGLFALFYSAGEGWLGIGSWRIFLPSQLYANYLTAYFGFAPKGFYSSDYFPLLPWVFLFWAGVFLHWALGRHRMEPLRRSVCPALGWLGRHSLVAYLLHQPVIYGLLLILDKLF